MTLHVLKHHADKYVSYTFLERGSDERQYCSPGMDLPIVSLMRSKYGAYSEYHTSLDNLAFISSEGLQGSFEALQKCLVILENNYHPKIRTLCEPQLGKRGLYPSLSDKNVHNKVYNIVNFLAYADGNNDLIDIAEKINVSALELIPLMKDLGEHGLLELLD